MIAHSSQAEMRRYDLDWLRIFALAILILYHVGMFYVPWEWHLKSRHPEPWVQVPMAMVNPWRLTLLFIVSGAATRFMYDRRSPGELAKSRIARLLPPLLFGMLVIVPPQTYLQVADELGTRLPVLDFYSQYLSAGGNWSAHGAKLVTPTWNHLWFVAYLLVYTLMLAGALALQPGLGSLLERWAERLLAGAGLIVWPIAWFSLVHIVLLPQFAETHALFGDWTVHAQSLPAFLLGFALARAEVLWTMLVAQRLTLTVAAVASIAMYAGTLALWIAGATDPGLSSTVLNCSFGAVQWLCCAAALSLAGAHLRRVDTPFRAYLTQAIFPFYIVHQTIILVAGYWLRNLGLPVAAEAIALVATTVAGCLLSYEFVKRVAWLRPLFGLHSLSR